MSAFFLAGIMCFSITNFEAFGAEKLYGEVTTQTVTKGVTYEFDHRLTAEGWQDIHVLKIRLNDPNVVISPVESSKEYGSKDTVLNMVRDGGAIAGVNGDFFGMKGSYSASFGPVVKDGNIVSVGTDKNLNKNEFSAFFLDEEGNPFIEFLKFQADFYANTNSHLELASYNKITEMKYPIYFDKNAATTTAELDKRFPDLVKFVVENGMITKVSQKGETITVPENGYLIIMNGAYYDSVSSYFHVGQATEIKVRANIDLNRIQTAVGGAGKILVNGQTVSDQGLVISGRQPRTALGISQDQSTLILMVVDGRTHSIGANHDELASLLKVYGAYNAMHLDGGGSSTMVAKTIDDNQVELKNTVSEGSQRRVMNGMAVFNRAPVGAATEIRIKPSEERVFPGNPVSFEVIGYDEYYHKINVPMNEVNFSVIGGEGNFSGNTFTPTTSGNFSISATWNGLTAVTNIVGMEAGALKADQEKIALSNVGDTATLSMSVVSTEGYTAPIHNGVSYRLSDESLGSMTGNVFTAQKQGAGYIEASMGDAVCYIPVSIGDSQNIITSFEDQSGLHFNAFPKSEILGSAKVSNKYYQDGNQSLELNYQFKESDSTQVAYISFSKAIVIPDKPKALKLSVFGNGSGDMVRAKCTDADGNDFTLEFAKEINWNGEWKELQASIPQSVVYPMKIDNIYCASTSNKDTTEKAVYFDRLVGVYPNHSTEAPQTSNVYDKKRGTVEKKEDGAYYVNIVGRVSSGTVANKELYETQRKKAKEFMETQADLAVYAGKSDISSPDSVDTIRWKEAYQYYDKPNLSIVQLTASKGGLRKTLPVQWARFTADVLNSQNENVIFIMDKTPSEFSDPMEMSLFRNVLQELKQKGKTVFVVSAYETGYWSNLKEGIRYINLPNLWTKDGQLNRDFTKLKLRIQGSDITYETTKMFE